MPRLYPHFVCIFGTRRQTDMRTKGHWFPAPAGRVFRGRKICLRYFKIGQTYFEICALYFLFAPMWDKHTENQFSFFRTGKRQFHRQFPLPVETMNRLYYGNENHSATASVGRQVSVIRAQKNAGMCDVTHMPALVRRFRPLPTSSVFTPARPLP